MISNITDGFKLQNRGGHHEGKFFHTHGGLAPRHGGGPTAPPRGTMGPMEATNGVNADGTSCYGQDYTFKCDLDPEQPVGDTYKLWPINGFTK